MVTKSRLSWVFVLLLLTLTGCSRPSGTGSTSGSTSGVKRYRIAVVPKGTAHAFWQTVKAGAEKAGEEENAEILWKGPADENDTPGQIAILEDFITSRVDAIVMAACDAKALIGTIKKAMEAGIPVITIDSGVESDLPLSYVATDNVEGGRIAARTLANLIGQKGKVGLIPFIKGARSSEERERGFKEGLKEFPGVQLVSVLYSQSRAEEGMKVTEDMLAAHPDLAGLFAANEPGVIGAARTLEQRGVAGKVKLVGYDASEVEIEALQKGVVQALIVQDPFRMGYEGTKFAIKAIRKEPIPKRVDTGVTVVTKENLEQPDIQKLLYPLGKP